MLKIDAHQHFWNIETLHYPWLSSELGILYRTYEPTDLEPHITACQVQGTVVVQAAHDLRETAWLIELAQQTPWIMGVVGWVGLTADDLEAQLSGFLPSGMLCGVRHQVHDELDPEWALQANVVRGLKVLAQHGLPYDLLVRPPHLKHLPRLFEHVPDMRWIVDHCAKPEIAAGTLEPWLSDMRAVAHYPNVYCKVSGLITEADHATWTTTDIRPYVEAVLELFGPSRLLWGSDWPVCLLGGSYERVHSLVNELIAELTPTEQAAIWGGTARSVYNLGGTDGAIEQ